MELQENMKLLLADYAGINQELGACKVSEHIFKSQGEEGKADLAEVLKMVEHLENRKEKAEAIIYDFLKLQEATGPTPQGN